ncbi:MAG: RagB/SusD family nutrient uptake outer membrane protein, partial [Bacteroidales bacterium]|nr:RagB/SusD family nutrient uptake outer membrane protein [Bacteroidales bacterium]
MKKIFIIVLTAVLALQGCDKMLDTTNYEKYDTSSFPKSQKDAEQMVTSIYNRLNWVYREPEEAPLFVNDLASDDMFGGGSTSNTGAQGLDRLMWDEAEGFTHSWDQIYRGIFRANYAIEQIPALDDALFDSADTKNYLLGQAYFLRAW